MSKKAYLVRNSKSALLITHNIIQYSQTFPIHNDRKKKFSKTFYDKRNSAIKQPVITPAIMMESRLERTLILFMRLPIMGNLLEMAFILLVMPAKPPRCVYRFSLVAIAILIASFVIPSALRATAYIVLYQ